jgi:hypothetical protein
VVTAAVAVLVVGLCFALVVALARDPGPPPGDVAVAYELAWDRLDFDALWALSGPELRDGRSRADFVAAKRAAYERRPELGGLSRRVDVDAVTSGDEIAVVSTRVELREGGVARNELHLARHDGRWRVTAYELRPDSRPHRGA